MGLVIVWPIYAAISKPKTVQPPVQPVVSNELPLTVWDNLSTGDSLWLNGDMTAQQWHWKGIKDPDPLQITDGVWTRSKGILTVKINGKPSLSLHTIQTKEATYLSAKDSSKATLPDLYINNRDLSKGDTSE